MSKPTSSRTIKLRFRLWLAMMLVMLAVFAVRVLPDIRIETDILALLPSEQGDAATNAAVDRFSQALAGKLLILVGAAEIEQAKTAAQAFAQQLRDSGAFAQVNLEQDGLNQSLLALYQPHRTWLLSQRHIDLLQAGQQAVLQHEALRAAFTPTGLMRAVSFADDPLGLANDYFMQQLPGMGAAQLDGKVLVVSGEQPNGKPQTYVLITTELNGSPFATQVQEAAQAALDAARVAAQQAIAPMRLEVVMSGTMPHAAAARERATDELSTFGTIETVMVMALLIGVFSALRPLALGALTMALAFVAGMCATHFVFGTVHVLALVFGSSLIGGVIDYSIHFFADRFRGDADWTPASAVDHVGGAILLGLSTTLLGYVVLLLVPFPGLRQIALFCVAGLATGCVTVLCAYPVLYRVPARSAAWGPRMGEWLAHQFKPGGWTRSRVVIASLLLLTALAGLHKVALQDDVRALQSSPPVLIAAEKRAAALLQTGIESRYFLVQGNSAQAVLESEWQLTRQLDVLKASGQLKSYTAVSRALPPLTQQTLAHELLQTRVLNEQGALRGLLLQLGFSPADATARVQAFAAGSTPLQVDAWLASDASRPYRDLWLGSLSRHRGQDQCASIVSLAGVKDVAALRALSQHLGDSGLRVNLIDRVAAVSEVLRSYRQAMSWLLCVVYGVAMALLSFKYGWREAPLLLLPSALASGVTLGLFGWLGVPVNLFTLLALWLVLGLGVDYGIFLRHGRTALPTAVLSVSLSAVTTLLAFGMLAFSATPFIRSIGLTLLCAISLSWLFAMLSCLTLRKEL
ncbi:MAG: MMPL family transporter [Steroidobacteraceae bacterium]